MEGEKPQRIREWWCWNYKRWQVSKNTWKILKWTERLLGVLSVECWTLSDPLELSDSRGPSVSTDFGLFYNFRSSWKRIVMHIIGVLRDTNKFYFATVKKKDSKNYFLLIRTLTNFASISKFISVFLLAYKHFTFPILFQICSSFLLVCFLINEWNKKFWHMSTIHFWVI